MTQTFSGVTRSKISANPSRRIFRVENHDAALDIWRNLASVGRILVHVDAHHDMWWVPSGQDVTIANFISPALQEGIFREIYWVVPDRSWESAVNRGHIFHQLRHIQRQFPGLPAPIEITHNHISTTLLGNPLRICSVDGLPKFEESVLLDLDVDYLILPRVAHGPDNPHPALPWQWPEKLVARLHSNGVRSDLVTIAYSVEGGFTPLRWKYLGDELEARLESQVTTQLLRGMDFMRAGAESSARGESAAAEQAYREASGLLPNLAAPLWHLAFLLLDFNRREEAQEMYRRALVLDPSYRTAHNSPALWHYWGQRWADSEREWRRTLAMDPNDAFAHVGLGWLAGKGSDWKEAELEMCRAIEVDPNQLDAHRGLGRVFRKTGRLRDAIAAYEKSLMLSLSGGVSLSTSPIISAAPPQWNDFRHFQIFRALGYLYRKVGEPERAAQFLSMAAAAGISNFMLHAQLASFAFKKRKRRAGLGEIGKAFKSPAVWAGYFGKKLLRHARRPFRRAYELWRVK